MEGGEKGEAQDSSWSCSARGHSLAGMGFSSSSNQRRVGHGGEQGEEATAAEPKA